MGLMRSNNVITSFKKYQGKSKEVMKADKLQTKTTSLSTNNTENAEIR